MFSSDWQINHLIFFVATVIQNNSRIQTVQNSLTTVYVAHVSNAVWTKRVRHAILSFDQTASGAWATDKSSTSALATVAVLSAAPVFLIKTFVNLGYFAVKTKSSFFLSLFSAPL
jgi:hypothetical protein